MTDTTDAKKPADTTPPPAPAPEPDVEASDSGPDTPRMPEDDAPPRDDFSRDVIAMDVPTEPKLAAALPYSMNDVETTVNLGGDAFPFPVRDDTRPGGYEPPPVSGRPSSYPPGAGEVSREHLKGLLEALIFASDRPIKAAELAKLASAPLKDVKLLLTILKSDFQTRGIQLDEVAGGWVFRTHAVYAPFVRDLTKQKPVRLTRAQIETLAILAYRQPITRPEIDEIRGVDSGPVLKLLLERDLVKILGKKDEPGRPILYGTTPAFLEFFGLKSLKDLPTLREFTELNEDSRRVVERELGDVLDAKQGGPIPSEPPPASAAGRASLDEAPTMISMPEELHPDQAPTAEVRAVLEDEATVRRTSAELAAAAGEAADTAEDDGEDDDDDDDDEDDDEDDDDDDDDEDDEDDDDEDEDEEDEEDKDEDGEA